MINEQRKRFIEEYLKQRCKNAKLAAIKAGYSPKSAESQASQILKDVKVQEYLNQRRAQIAQEIREEFIFDALEARRIMFEIMTDPEASDRDKIMAAKDFLDRAGFKPPEKMELSGEVKNSNPFAELTVEQLRKLAGEVE